MRLMKWGKREMGDCVYLVLPGKLPQINSSQKGAVVHWVHHWTKGGYFWNVQSESDPVQWESEGPVSPQAEFSALRKNKINNFYDHPEWSRSIMYKVKEREGTRFHSFS